MQQATDGNRVHTLIDPPADVNRLRGLADPAPVAVRSAVVVRAPAAAPARTPRWRRVGPAVLVAVCVAAGVGLRGFCYARNQSLWLDEAMLALNVVHRPPAGLLEPLDLNQGAPVGYLLATKLVVQAFGPGELSLRFLSIVAGLVGMAAFVPLAYRALPVGAARMAACLFALSPYLAGYSAEFKQYELDATIALLLTAIGLPVWRNQAGPWRLVGFAAAGAAAVWFSHPAAFVLGGVGLAALADAAARRDRAAFLARLAVIGAWGVSFGLCFLLFTRKLGMNDYLLNYWSGKFMPFPPKGLGDVAWLVHHYFEFFQKPGGFNADGMAVTGLAGVLAGVGGLALARADWRLLVALGTPLLLALLASALKKYPFANRLLMFAVPAAILVVAYGAAVTARRVGRGLPLAGAAVVAALFVGPVAECRWLLKKPTHAEDAREALAHVHARWQPGDQLYVYYGAVPAYCYYHPRFPFPAEAVRFGAENRGRDQRKFHEEVQVYRGQRRLWVVMAHRQGPEDTALRAYLDGMGRRDELARWNDSAAMRYDLTAPPAAPDPAFRTDDKRPE